MNFKRTLLSFSCLMAAPLVCSGFAAQAQEAAPVPQTTAQAGDADTKDTVVVTGSRIRRTNTTSAVPLQVFGTAELEETGTTDLAEALLQLPGVSEGVSPQNSNNLIQVSGLSTVSLRRLGDDRTLVLINGKRAVSNAGASDRVSLSTLPLGFVRRTEVTTGGASAIYGSGAIAGVANFLLQDSFEGAVLDARYSTPEASGGEEYRLNARAGSKFANDRGYVLVGASYRDENAVRADESRPLSILALEFDDPSTLSSNSFANELNQPGCSTVNVERHCFLGSLSGSTPGGVFENGDAWFRDGQWFNDRSLQPADRTGTQDFLADFDGFNFRPGRTLLSEREIFTLALHSTYELTPNIEANFTGSYSDVDSVSTGGYETLNDSDTLGDGSRVGNIASDHPFIPAEVEETRFGSVDFDRRVVELGEQARINSRETYRFMGGFSGDIADVYNWEAYGTFGRFKQVQRNPNELNFLNARFALDIESDGAGGFQCADAAARADGCVPLNLFGAGSITPAAADYIRYNGLGTQVRKQYTAGASINGPVFDLPAGAVQMAGGFEWRREGQNTVGDPDGDLVGGLDGDPTTADVDVTSVAVFPDLRANFEVIEGFAEIDIPVLRDRLSVQAALRVSDYDTVGNIFSFNAGGVLTVSEDIKFRGQFSRSQRAPNLTEVFSPPRPDADDLLDPCTGLLADGTRVNGQTDPVLDIVNANCLTEPGIQQFFIDNPGDFFEFDGSVQGPNAGNPNVQEETADTITLGAVITPQAIPNFSLVADYYQIQIDDAITSISTQDTVDLCYASDDFPNNRFCDVITRNAFDGEVEEVINFQENLEREIVEGVDVSVLYDFDTQFIPGNLRFDFRYSHYFKDLTIFEGLGGELFTDSPLGEIGSGNDEFRLNIRFRDNHGFRISYTVNFEDGGIDDRENDGNRVDDRFFSANAQTFHNVFLSKTFDVNNRDVRLYGGVNNIFNNFGPFLPSGLDRGSTFNIVSGLNNALGREFYGGLRITF